MLSCFFCGTTCTNCILLKAHLQVAHSGTWKSPYVCGQRGCFRTFQNVFCWRRHVENQHKDTPVLHDDVDYAFHDESDQESIPWLATAMDTSEGDEPQDLRKGIERTVIEFVLKLRSSSSVTISTCEHAVQAADSLIESVVLYLEHHTRQFLTELDTDADIKPLLERFEEMRTPLKFLSTDKQQREFFRAQPNFVAPVSVSFGLPRYEITRSRSGDPRQKAVSDTWQYVPIGRTLQAVLSNEEVFRAMSLEVSNKYKDSISDFKDGLRYAKLDLPFSYHKTTAVLQLYYDDFEVANPLGSKTGLHKEAVFYFSIKNLPTSMTRNMSNIFLVALAKTADVRNYGYDAVLNKILSELQELELNGVQVEVAGATRTVYAVLGLVIGDNLARHAVFGLNENFSRARRPCSTCFISQDDLQTAFFEDPALLRTREQYEQQLASVLLDPSNSTTTGIKRACVLNALPSWHVTENFAGDLMHDFLEGVGPYELKLVLYHLIAVDKLFSLSTLNSAIAFFGYGKTDAKNRPSEIRDVNSLLDRNLSLKQKAMQFYCLFRLLPLMIGDLIPAQNSYWEFYLQLREIGDILFAQRWTMAMIEQYRVLYAEHLQRFTVLFPSYKLIPKHHFLLHYGTFALNTGPPYKLMTSSEEMKGNFFKRMAGIMCNYKNVPYSLANKHQFFAYLNLAGHRLLNKSIEIVKTAEIMLSNFSCSEMLKLDFGFIANEMTIAVKYVISGQMYSEGDIVPLSFDNFGNVVFGVLVGAFVSDYIYDNTSIVLLLKACETIDFDYHLHCYKIKVVDDVFCGVRQGSLLDYHPIDRYSTEVMFVYNVCLRYALL